MQRAFGAQSHLEAVPALPRQCWLLRGEFTFPLCCLLCPRQEEAARSCPRLGDQELLAQDGRSLDRAVQMRKEDHRK